MKKIILSLIIPMLTMTMAQATETRIKVALTTAKNQPSYISYSQEYSAINNTELGSNGDYTEEAEESKTNENIYDEITKPIFEKTGNTTFAEYATISNGNGIENHSENIIPAELTIQGQNGRTEFIEVEAGATFNLDITYVFNWHDITIVKIEKGTSEIVYGSFKGEWPNFPEEVVKESMSNAGLTVNENTVTYPIALSNDLKEGDMVVIRTVTADNFDLNKQDAYSEGSYMDFVFVVKAEGSKTNEDIYDEITKPIFEKAGNTTFAEYATISNGNGIENHSENIIPAELTIQGQNGRTDFIEVEAGATFNLDITYVFNWGDITIVKIENGASEIVYGSFKGEWPNFPEEVVKESMSNARLTVNEKTVTYPIALSNDLQEGDMVVIRTITANDFDLDKSEYSEGSYMDFVFVVPTKNAETAIENVNVETANNAIYDITGRRVKEITNAGIYIINGKKTFVK